MGMFRHTASSLLVLGVILASPALADNSQLQAKLAQIKASISANQQRLAQYAWQQQETISVKGDVKQQNQYLVQIGPNGKQQKTLESAPPSQGRRHGIKHDISQEYQDYGKQIAALAQSYAQPDPGKLQQLYQQGQVTLGSAGAPGAAAIVIHNYVKPGDTMTLVFGTAQKALLALNISTYLSSPSDAVTITAQFAQLPDGTNYVQTMTINGSSKQLVVQQQNSGFQKKS
jgi:hypothetical protein